MASLEEILQAENLPTGLDIVELFRQGVQYVKDYSGKHWNDYNLHDPGITVLENIVNSLVDLFYRSSFDIQSILNSEGRFVDLPNIEKILPTNPVTINDLRKKILFDVKELNNLWVIPVSSTENSFRGIYDLWLDIDQVNDQNSKDIIIEKVREAFSNIRNLCEDLNEIIVLEPLKIKVKAVLEADDSNQIEDIYATILYKINEFFRPKVKFYPIEEIKQNISLDKIYTGPNMGNFYIKDEDLTEKNLSIQIPELIRLVSEITGVKTVRSLILVLNNKEFEDQLIIEKFELPYLSNIDDLNKSNDSFTFTSGFSQRNIDYELLKRKLSTLQIDTKQQYFSFLTSFDQIQVPLDFKSYKSIQLDFPEIYGIGELGLPISASLEHRASIKQMKAWILSFEQIMADFLTALSNINRFFAVNEIISAEHYVQKVSSIPNLDEIIMNHPEKQIDSAFFAKAAIPCDYISGMVKLKDFFTDFTDKHSRFLDFYLSVLGEKFYSDFLRQSNSYFSKEVYEVKLLEYKQRFLFWLPEINKNKTLGYNYLENNDSFALSGVQIKAALMLGFEAHFMKKIEDGFYEPNIADSFLDSGLELCDDLDTMNIDQALSQKINDLFQTDTFDYIDPEDFPNHSTDLNDILEILGKTAIFANRKIFPELFREGIDIKNFQVGKLGEEFILVYSKFGTNTWRYMGSFSNYEEACCAALVLIDYIIRICVKAEGMYLIEHSLLRPRLSKDLFGIYILDYSGNPFLFSESLYTNSVRNEILEILKIELNIYSNYSIHRDENGNHSISFQSSDKSIKFSGVKSNTSVRDIYSYLEDVYLFITDKYETTPYNQKYSFFIQFKKTNKRIPEEYFSYHVSAILPAWTHRFSKPEFREATERIIRQIAPAYIKIDFYWLMPDVMKRFEKSYQLWKQGFKEVRKSVDNVLNKNILKYLLGFMSNNSENE